YLTIGCSEAPSVTALRVRGLILPHSASVSLICCDRSVCVWLAPGACDAWAGVWPRLGLGWPGFLPPFWICATSRCALAICWPGFWPGCGAPPAHACLRD